MSHVDVINRLQMNERQQHNFDRLDAQVDAHQRNQHGECYKAPEQDMAEHRINSPTINIGTDAAMAMSDAVGMPISPPHKKPLIPNWAKAALLAGATAIGTGAVMSYLASDDDTRNVYDIKAMPFDPDLNPFGDVSNASNE